MSSSTSKPKIKESLLDAIGRFAIYAHYHQYAREMASDALDALEYGSCSNRSLLNVFLIWYQKEYPALKILAPQSDEVKWIEKLKLKVDEIKAKIKRDGNFQQN